MYIYTRIHMFTDVYMYTDPTSNPTPINIWHVPHNPTLTPLLYTKRRTIYIHILQRIFGTATQREPICNILQHVHTHIHTYIHTYTYMFINIWHVPHTHTNTHKYTSTHVCVLDAHSSPK